MPTADDQRSSAEVGICCPKCGCRHLLVSYGKGTIGGQRRVKICRHCGQRVQTREVIERLLPPTKKRLEEGG